MEGLLKPKKRKKVLSLDLLNSFFLFSDLTEDFNNEFWSRHFEPAQDLPCLLLAITVYLRVKIAFPKQIIGSRWAISNIKRRHLQREATENGAELTAVQDTHLQYPTFRKWSYVDTTRALRMMQ